MYMHPYTKTFNIQHNAQTFEALQDFSSDIRINDVAEVICDGESDRKPALHMRKRLAQGHGVEVKNRVDDGLL